MEFGNVRLVGAVAQFERETNELLFWRIGRVRAKDRIGVWLRLLALIGNRQEPATAHLFGARDQVERVVLQGPEPDQARSLLDDWVEAWREGHRRPLPFFASTSWEWTAKGAWTGRVDEKWSGRPYSEGNNSSHRLIFGDGHGGDDFEHLAERLLRPLREASK